MERIKIITNKLLFCGIQLRIFNSLNTNKLMEINNRQMKQEYNNKINTLKEQPKKDVEDVEELIMKINNQNKWFW